MIRRIMRPEVRDAARTIDACAGVEIKFDARIKIEINIDIEPTPTRTRIFRDPIAVLREGFTTHAAPKSRAEILTINTWELLRAFSSGLLKAALLGPPALEPAARRERITSDATATDSP